MTPAIRVENLGKRYRIGVPRGKLSVREALAGAAAAPLRRLRSGAASNAQTIWALRDLDFEVAGGEALGIIGRNGAGKSTLLKILSRITRPTTGRAILRGRPTSLLEVGTGFHPDLTGRENIYMSGAVLGMSRAEIKGKFDAIVAFAETERFLDTPVKHYSSGMYMRLAFAVAAHLEPSTLVLDEVLAVGDAAFQRKCQLALKQMLGDGCTLVLVSHNLHAIATLCTRALWLDAGTLRADGRSRDVIAAYLAQVSRQPDDSGECRWPDPEEAPGDEKIRLRAVRILSGGRVTSRVRAQDPVRVEIEYANLSPGANVYTSIYLMEESGVGVLSTANLPSFNLGADAWHGRPQPAGVYRSLCTIPGHLLNHSRYTVSVYVVTEESRLDVAVHNAISFQVYDGEGGELQGAVMGVIRPRLDWDTELVQPCYPPLS
jgi:lipopolysaccharide transport system ATP-binding protein